MVTVTSPEADQDGQLPTRHRRDGVPHWYEAAEMPRGDQDMPYVGIRPDVSFAPSSRT